MEARVPARLTRTEGRRFGLTVGGAFLLLTLLLWWRGHDIARLITALAALPFLAGGLLLPDRMGPLYRAWMRLGLAISKVTTPIFMAVIFFLVITPFGVGARVLGHRPLQTKRTGTLWRERAEGERKSDLQRQF